ncbi:MAG TPA: translation initiation factor IF-1 [bacterium]|nr:translation initiation factor IF-1 [bacterium]
MKSLPGGVFEVQVSGDFAGEGYIVRAQISGKMRKNRITLIPGDSVTLELTPYDLTKGRITFRKGNRGKPPASTSAKS